MKSKDEPTLGAFTVIRSFSLRGVVHPAGTVVRLGDADAVHISELLQAGKIRPADNFTRDRIKVAEPKQWAPDQGRERGPGWNASSW